MIRLNLQLMEEMNPFESMKHQGRDKRENFVGEETGRIIRVYDERRTVNIEVKKGVLG